MDPGWTRPPPGGGGKGREAADDRELEKMLGKAFVKSAARRRRDREYSAARREQARFDEDLLAAEIVHLAESIERAREERRQLQEEAHLLSGRLAVRDDTVAFLRLRLKSVQLARGAEVVVHSEESSALAETLAERYGEGASAIVDTIERLQPSAASSKKYAATLAILAKLPAPPPPRNSGRVLQPMPYGLVLEILPFGQHWAGWLLSQVSIYYLENFFLNPDCPMYMVSTMFPADFERTISRDELTPARFGELVRLNSDANVLSPEARMREWAVQTKVALGVLSRFRTPAELVSREFVELVRLKLAPTARLLAVQFFARLAGENRWMFAHLVPPRWMADEESFDGLLELLEVSMTQKRHLNRLFDEMVDAVKPLGLDLKTSTAEAIEAISEDASSLSSRLKLLKSISLASVSSVRLRKVIGWYGIIFHFAFSERQVCIATIEGGRPYWSLELAIPIIVGYRNSLP